ncbi:phosphatase PAP2 family protein [Taibaiella chishuiensis]|uniref:PAP2 superfamily protein n=1 Tax=Taibaiella chishuiensis TaxID=1434707 RepID=A0A2P8D7L1_9BACT|nr:phosphatase PAP2 family protein [Taibaiella chishuiensis]PSK93220.1 PAP2 superfamily protein [Taibaiella chishuiensis]
MNYMMQRYTGLLLLLLLTLSMPARGQFADSMAKPAPPVFQPKSLVVPAALLAAGVLITVRPGATIGTELVEERNEHFGNFGTHIDNYLQYAPVAVAYGLDAAGIPSRTDLLNRTVILLKGTLLMTGVVTLLKNTTHVLRPDGSAYNSFPSGHTAQAFAAATFLSEEYKERFPWMPYAAYGSAACVGALRMANNRHYLGDVLAGAALGILSMKLAYWTHQYKWGKPKHHPRGFDPKSI